MSSTYTPSLRLDQQAVGANNDTWGLVLNTDFALLDQAVAGMVTIAMPDATLTLSAVQGAPDQARAAVLFFTGVLTGTRDVVVPSVPKLYVIGNGTSHPLQVRTAVGGADAVVVPVGVWVTVFCDGGNVRPQITWLPSLLVEGALTAATVNATALNIGGSPVWSPGDYKATAVVAPPPGWLLCNGAEVSRTTYAALFAAIGTAYGAGNGSTTFNIPDLRGRVLAGADNMGGVAAGRLTGGIIGAGLGFEAVVLGVPEMPVHTHANVIFAAGAHNHYNPAGPIGQQGGWTSTAPAHSHGVGTSYGIPGWTAAAGAHVHQVLSNGSGVQGGGSSTSSWNNVTIGATSPQGGTFVTDTAPEHSHVVTIDANGAHMHEIGIWTEPNHTHGLTNAPAGGNAAHANVQPSMVCNWLIKT